MDTNLLVAILSLVAGVCGTAIGGVIGVFIKGKGNKLMGGVLGFAGGVMLGVVTFEMIPEAIEFSTVNFKTYTGVLIALATVIAGAIAIFGLNKLLDVVENKRGVHRELTEMHHQTAILNAAADKQKEEGVEQPKSIDLNVESKDKRGTGLLKAGFVMLVAIALHNFPEGMAIGATGVADASTGVFIAIVIALHNIPEGMAISAPLAGGGVKPWKTIGLTALAGFATVLGALLGVLLGGISNISTGICMGLAGGAMLYVTFGEILPEATLMTDGKIPCICMLIGLVFIIPFILLF